MTLTPAILHARLVQLLDEMPNITAEGPRSEAVRRWTARATILVEESGDGVDTAKITVAVDNMARDVWHAKEIILTVLHRALARAENRMPAGARGGFIAAGSPFDALASVGKVLSTATSDTLIVDPYADERLLTDYALLAPESIGLRILTDKAAHKPALKPAAERWTQQHGTKRPLQVRLAASKTLHDRSLSTQRRCGSSANPSTSWRNERTPASRASRMRIPPR